VALAVEARMMRHAGCQFFFGSEQSQPQAEPKRALKAEGRQPEWPLGLGSVHGPVRRAPSAQWNLCGHGASAFRPGGTAASPGL
jgi:hypothetical protein